VFISISRESYLCDSKRQKLPPKKNAARPSLALGIKKVSNNVDPQQPDFEKVKQLLKTHKRIQISVDDLW